AVALARHYREAEGLSNAQIAARLGRSVATVKAYFYDPTGAKARAVKARYQGVCRGCGAYTQARNGKGDAYAYCKTCHPGAIEPRWTREGVVSAMGEWVVRYGSSPSSYDWSGTHARRRGGEALDRLATGQWPSASVVSHLFGTWAAARTAAATRGRGAVGAVAPGCRWLDPDPATAATGVPNSVSNAPPNALNRLYPWGIGREDSGIIIRVSGVRVPPPACHDSARNPR
ncbi:MAG: hypothetical protein QOC77_1623, partial [Thermoleophilaceae bacterium]|nr:hypothetical protein [Thermoleophilaceae bacterium]